MRKKFVTWTKNASQTSYTVNLQWVHDAFVLIAINFSVGTRGFWRLLLSLHVVSQEAIKANLRHCKTTYDSLCTSTTFNATHQRRTRFITCTRKKKLFDSWVIQFTQMLLSTLSGWKAHFISYNRSENFKTEKNNNQQPFRGPGWYIHIPQNKKYFYQWEQFFLKRCRALSSSCVFCYSHLLDNILAALKCRLLVRIQANDEGRNHPSFHMHAIIRTLEM